MNVYICYPCPYKGGRQDFDSVYAAQLYAAVQPNGWRVNFDPRSNQTDELLALPGNLIPIIDMEDKNQWHLLAPFVDMLLPKLLARGGVPFIEIGNEPYTLRRTSGRDYAREVRDLSSVVAGRLPVAIACDALRPNAWRDKAWLSFWWEAVDWLSPQFWDIAAIHPYRAGDPTVSRINWPTWAHKLPWLGNRFHKHEPRIIEHEYWKKLAMGKPVAVTEVGWGITDKRAAEWMELELQFQNSVWTETVCVYAHPHCFSPETRAITPVGEVVKRWSNRGR
jgi:hypothetical protein